jgi:hypothetical protein
VARRLAPLPLLVLAVASAYLASTAPFYAAAALGQTAFYGLALLGFLLRRVAVGRLKPIYVPFYYCMANVASVIAVVQALRGQRIASWQPQRQAVP